MCGWKRGWTVVLRSACWVFLSLIAGTCRRPAEVDTFELKPTRGYILISIDTLRADHLGCYGYDLETSPFIDSLAAQGVLFETAIVQLPGTLPSHMSIFTGLYPEEHGVFPPDAVLAETIATLPEVFKRHGFRTGGFTEGGYVDGSYGFARGFDTFRDHGEQGPRRVEQTFARGLDFLRLLETGERFFLFLHTYAVHDPYYPPEPFASQFGASPPAGAFPPTGPNFVAFNRGRKTISPEALAYYRAAYDASIRYLDEVLAEFFAELGELGLIDEVTVVLTSDHGEEFLEHGKMVHVQIYRETLHVPLLVLHPDLPPGRIASVVESIDIAPTLLDLAGLSFPSSVSGRTLLPCLRGLDEPLETEAYAVAHTRRSRSLLRATDRELYQLLETEHDPWITRRITFETTEAEIRFDALSYYEPRQLHVVVDGAHVRRVELRPGHWQEIRIALPESAVKKLVTLATDGCTSPSEIGESQDRRCLSFRLRGQPLLRSELYELRQDPQATTDLSVHPATPLGAMQRHLRSYEFEPLAAGERQEQELSPELRERLKALGYL